MSAADDKAKAEAAARAKANAPAATPPAATPPVKSAEDELAELKAKLAAAEAKLAKAESDTDTNVVGGSGDGRRKYKLLTGVYHEVTSPVGKPLQVREYKFGDMVPLTDERAREFIEAGVVEDPDAPELDRRGAQTKPPRG